MQENEAVIPDGEEVATEAPEEAVESDTSADDSPSSETEPTQENGGTTNEPASSEAGTVENIEEQGSLSSKANKRYQQLANENRRLREKLGEGMYGVHEQPAALPWANQPAAEPYEITEDQYQRDIAQRANAVVDARMREYERKQRLSEDIRTLEATYSELNPESDRYDEELTNKLVKQFKLVSKGDPDVRLSEYVEDVMALRERGREEGKSEVSGKVLEQAARQAVSAQGEPSPTESSSEEELIKLRREGKISFAEFERRVEELTGGGE